MVNDPSVASQPRLLKSRHTATAMVSSYWDNIPAVLAYFLIVTLTCLNTALLALFCSAIFSKTSISMMTSYLAIILLFCAPVAAIRRPRN